MNHQRIFQGEKNPTKRMFCLQKSTQPFSCEHLFLRLWSFYCVNTSLKTSPISLSGYESGVLLRNPSVSHKRLHPRNYILLFLYSVLYKPTGKLSKPQDNLYPFEFFLFFKNKIKLLEIHTAKNVI